jgi:hypothetical protein
MRFTATGALPTAKRLRILPMNQYACWPIPLGMWQLAIHILQKALKIMHSSLRRGRRSDLPLDVAVNNSYFTEGVANTAFLAPAGKTF